jgi:hypothetical protein
MIGRQAVAQPDRHVQGRIVINGFEGSTHMGQCSPHRPNRMALSDRLLADRVWV